MKKTAIAEVGVSSPITDNPVLSDMAKKSLYPNIYQFLINETFDETLSSKCPSYIEYNADKFYHIILKHPNTHPIPLYNKDLDQDDLVFTLLYENAKYEDIVHNGIFSVSPFPAYMDPGASTHIDQLDEDISELERTALKTFLRDYWQKQKEQKKLQKKIHTVNNELKSLPPSSMLSNGGSEYQAAFERNIGKFSQ